MHGHGEFVEEPPSVRPLLTTLPGHSTLSAGLTLPEHFWLRMGSPRSPSDGFSELTWIIVSVPET
jgi:hypothetical protein